MEKKSMRELKRIVGTEPPRFMRLWYLLAAASLVGFTVYYLNESDYADRKIDQVTKMLSSGDPETIREGLNALDSLLFIPKRLITTIAEMPQPKSTLVERGTVEGLLNVLKTVDDPVMRDTALIWLGRLSDSAAARRRITPGIDSVFQTLSSAPVGTQQWLTSSALLLSLSKYKDSVGVLMAPAAVERITQMFYSGHPLATLIAARLLVQMNDVNPALLTGSKISREQLSRLTTESCTAALHAAIRSAVPREPEPVNPILHPENTMMHLNYALVMSAVASVYGRTRWWLKARVNGLKGKTLRKFVAKRNKTGRYVFLLLSMDLITQALLAWPKEGLMLPFVPHPLYLPQSVAGLPMHTVIPIEEAVLFTVTALYALRTQRYVLFPLVLASTIAYRKHITDALGPYSTYINEIADYAKKTVVAMSEGSTGEKK